ncbi:hypothetical protein [Aureimonas sp. ME7]|uniref:hypothetical protein n=1 Tax=Aureimonas sp. ME7 TaxID=2744252 RepID=UPI0015F3ECD7|nr:hypothetical protein [Aureimonas sp. ME7]
MGGYRIRVSKEIHQFVSEKAMRMGVTPETVIARLVLRDMTADESSKPEPKPFVANRPVLAIMA